VIADRLAASKRDAPHYYMSSECQADALLAMRRDLNATLPESARLSVNDLILGFTAHCLARHPALNAAWGGDDIVTFQHVNLAVAVAVDGGLVTPVLRHAEALSLRQIHAQMQELMDAARRRALPREAFAGGTFTVSNLGMYPISQFAAIVNPPQAAILAVAAAQRRVVAVDAARSAVRRVMTLTLSVDHRVADGVAGAEFLSDLRALIEEPRRALL
jgi:pyruvate dehydrogenase E2 component (dihydrolipoamide acetyltransferase)